jgi:hypothetical protein
VVDVRRLEDDGIVSDQRLDVARACDRCMQRSSHASGHVAVVQVTSMVVPPELSKPIPELDVPGVVSETLGLETNGLTYAALLLPRLRVHLLRLPRLQQLRLPPPRPQLAGLVSSPRPHP